MPSELQKSKSMTRLGNLLKSARSKLAHIGTASNMSASKSAASVASNDLAEEPSESDLMRSSSIFAGHVETDIWETYSMGEEIGRGAFGTVVKVTDKETGSKYACKIVPLNLIKDPAQVEAIILEAEIMLHVRGHKNILKIKSFHQCKDNLYVVEELCSGGDLVQAVTANAMHFSESMAANVMRAVMESLAHCHALGVVHRDIKLDNFLLSKQGKDLGERLRLADFGYGAWCSSSETLSDYAGTPDYMAPEVLAGKYGQPADIWSCGVLMYVMLSGTFPFEPTVDMTLERAIQMKEPNLETGQWRHISTEAKDCIRAMLNKDPSQRPSARQVIEMAWFKNEGLGVDRPLQGPISARLIQWAETPEFRKEVLRRLVKHLEKESLLGYHHLWDTLTGGGSDKLPWQKAEEMLSSRGATPEQLQFLKKSRLHSEDNNVHFSEFIAAVAGPNNVCHVGCLDKVFKELDVEGMGSVSRAKLISRLNLTNEDELDKMLSSVNCTDGEMTKSHFYDIMLDHAGMGPIVVKQKSSSMPTSQPGMPPKRPASNWKEPRGLHVADHHRVSAPPCSIM